MQGATREPIVEPAADQDYSGYGYSYGGYGGYGGYTNRGGCSDLPAECR